MNFRTRLRQARNKRGLTQCDVAKLTGINRAQISFFETGAREPNLKKIALICYRMGISADYLLGLKQCDHSAEKIKLDAIRRVLADERQESWK